MIKFKSGASLGVLAFAIAGTAQAQEAGADSAARTQQGGIPTILVTAQKRSEDLQDVPVSVSAIGEEQLNQLNINTFEDYLDQLPNVTAGGSGPGQSTIYIRGLASTTPNLTTAGVAVTLMSTQPISNVSRFCQAPKALCLVLAHRLALFA